MAAPLMLVFSTHAIFTLDPTIVVVTTPIYVGTSAASSETRFDSGDDPWMLTATILNTYVLPSVTV